MKIKFDKDQRTVAIVILLSATFFLFAKNANAQETGFHYGARFGLGESKLISEGIDQSNGKLLLSGGFTSTYQLTDFLGIGADLLVTSKGDKTQGTYTSSGITSNSYAYTENFSMIYTEVPVTGKLSIPITKNLYLKGFAGPSMNFNLLSSSTRQYDNQNYNEENGYVNKPLNGTEVIEYSIIYGAGFDVIDNNQKMYFLDLRISKPISALGEINGESASNKYMNVSAGYMF